MWRKIQRENFTKLESLLSFLELENDCGLIVKNPRFTLNLPKRIAEKIEKGNLKDPLLIQFLPVKEENAHTALFVLDPLQEADFRKKSKLLHKYEGRALFLCTGACAMHCRFCFRQHFDYQQEDKLFEEELAVIWATPTLTEIILSGGDPLSLSNTQLGYLMGKLAEIPHLKRIRFHTRFPIGIPERIDSEFLTLLATSSKQVVFVIHTNHERELDYDVLDSLNKIQRLGIPVLSQTVLLKGVNDNFEALKGLFEKLSNHGVIPYYLHQLDRVQGAAHFEVSESVGIKLIDQLRAALPGYAVPKYVREISHLPNKAPIS